MYNITLRSVIHVVDGWNDLSDFRTAENSGYIFDSQLWLFYDNLETSHISMTILGSFQCSCSLLILRTYKNRVSLSMVYPCRFLM